VIYFNTTGAMTVGSLIEELQKLPHDMKVFVNDMGQFRDIALWMPKLKHCKYKNGFVGEPSNQVNVFVHADDLCFPGDSKPENCLIITTRRSA